MQQRETKFNFQGFLEGIKKSFSIIIGVIPFGAIFGILSSQTGLSLGESTLMSALVFSGGAQFIALGLWHYPLPILAITATTFLVNLRYILMGAAIRPHFENLGFAKSYGSAMVLSDGGWALQMQEFEQGNRNAAFILGSGAGQYFVWVSSSVLGFLLGSVLPNPEKIGLTFIVPASFLAILIGMWRGKASILPWLSACLAALATYFLVAGNWYVLAGGITGSLVGAVFNGETKKR